MLLLSSRLYRVAAATSTAVAFSLLPQAFSLRSMSSFIAERKDGTVIISPRDEASQSALVVISHGLGDTAEGFADVAEVRAHCMYSEHQACCLYKNVISSQFVLP